MRRLLLAPLCLLAACASRAPGVRPSEPPRAPLWVAEPVPLPELAPPPGPVLPPEPPMAVAGVWRAPSEAARVLAAAIVERAVQLVGTRRLGKVARHVPDDCSGLVRLAYLRGGIDLVSHGFLAGENAVSAIYRRAEARGAVHQDNPRPGDLVFFRETYDRNRDGRRNDGLTHVAVVERVEADGVLTFIHRGMKGIARSRMNLAFPATHRAGTTGAVLNDYLRPAARGQRAWLTGELFAGFASPEAL